MDWAASAVVPISITVYSQLSVNCREQAKARIQNDLYEKGWIGTRKRCSIRTDIDGVSFRNACAMQTYDSWFVSANRGGRIR